MKTARVLLALCCVTVLLAGGAAVGTASRPPQPICGVCGAGLTFAAEQHGARVTPTGSTVDVQLASNGSARWTARVTVTGRGVDDLQANDTLRALVVEQAADAGVVDAKATRSHLANGTLVVTYRASDLADASMGVLLVDAFAPRSNQGYVLRTNRLTLTAPDGYRLAKAPSGPNVDANATTAVWHGDTDGRAGFDATYLAFAPAGTSLAGARSTLAVLARVLPGALVATALYAFPPALLLGSAALLLARRRNPDAPWLTARRATVAFFAAFVGLVLVAGLLSRGTIPAAFTALATLILPAAGFAALGAHDRSSTVTRLLVAAFVLVPLFLAGWHALDTLGVVSPLSYLYLPVFGALYSLAALLLGVPAFALGRVHRRDGARTTSGE